MSKYLFNLRIKFYDITTQMKAESYLILRIKFYIFCELCLRPIIISLKIWLGKNLPFSNHFTFYRIVCFSDPFTGNLWGVTCSISISLAHKFLFTLKNILLVCCTHSWNIFQHSKRTFESLCGYDCKISMYGCV